MSEFIVRVELHGAGEAHYNLLHQAMGRRGLSREIYGADGVRYQLPPAEYHARLNVLLEQVRTLAVAAANETGCRSAVVVTEGTRIGWVGLDKS